MPRTTSDETTLVPSVVPVRVPTPNLFFVPRARNTTGTEIFSSFFSTNNGPIASQNTWFRCSLRMTLHQTRHTIVPDMHFFFAMRHAFPCIPPFDILFNVRSTISASHFSLSGYQYGIIILGSVQMLKIVLSRNTIL